MDTKPRVEQSGVTESTYCDSIKESDKDCTVVESKDASLLSPPPLAASPPLAAVDTGGSSLGPITPYPNKECADLMSNFTSPLTLVPSPPTTGSDTDSQTDAPCTPREGVFDPFAPGPDKLMLAPHCLKNVGKTRSFVARRLHFGSLTSHNKHTEKGVSEAEFEKVYDTLLEAIIFKEAEDILAEILGRDLSPGEPMTPPFVPRLTGIAETCPGAPLKPVRQSRNIDLSLCRKLEFEF